MSKTDLIAAVAAKMETTKKDAKVVVDTVLDTIVDELKAGEEVALTGFGKFYTSDIPARDGRNPQTGESLKIAAHKSPRFKAGKLLKAVVNE